jgi:broad specificity phosphatase PhoE
MRTLRSLLALVALAGCTSSGASPRQTNVTPDLTGATTVVIVRHAEKAGEPAADPPLTAAGVLRARALVDAVHGMPVTAIISTNFARTRGTAAPLAERLGVTPEIVDARAPDHARLVAEGILTRHRGETVVVVGHSNTVPDIVAALGAAKPAAICDAQYDNLYVVRVPATGQATVSRTTYGARSPEDTSCRGMR